MHGWLIMAIRIYLFVAVAGFACSNAPSTSTPYDSDNNTVDLLKIGIDSSGRAKPSVEVFPSDGRRPRLEMRIGEGDAGARADNGGILERLGIGTRQDSPPSADSLRTQPSGPLNYEG